MDNFLSNQQRFKPFNTYFDDIYKYTKKTYLFLKFEENLFMVPRNNDLEHHSYKSKISLTVSQNVSLDMVKRTDGRKERG